jgi:vitamin B12 transporter
LWGSDAIGGVIAINGVADEAPGYATTAEGGSFGFARAGGSASVQSGPIGLAGAVGWQRAAGIDSFDGEGDRDGYRNLAARVRGTWNIASHARLGIAGLSLTGRSQFDGYDPVTFVHADTLDSSRNRLSAGRLWADFGDKSSGFSGTASVSLLKSRNRNFLDEDEINWTSGKRETAEAQLQYSFSAGSVAQTAVVAFDHDSESFSADDSIYGGATRQNRHRRHDALTGEWRAQFKGLVADIALRRDRFSAFKDATTVRASGLVRLGSGFSLTSSYSEGIAQPTFFDLYGSFPGLFAGNAGLKAERSRGFEASLRFRRSGLSAALTAYRQKLHDEIVTVSVPGSFVQTAVNRSTSSHRSSLEAEVDWSLSPALRVSANYALLHATEPTGIGASQIREVRRPKHSGSIALDGRSGLFSYGASVAYVGRRSDNDFDVYPAIPVTLGSYWLIGARLAYAVRPGAELFVRGSNLVNEHYQDVFGYRTEGRAVYAGVRLSG